VSAERVFALAPHLTERDREIALRLYDHQLLTTDQLQLLFFSSKRRAQDRLLFLYRNRVVDRFYPPSPFGAGKPQAHWLLDEAGAILVCAMLDLERKELGWRRRDDWGSHPQLVHRLEMNRFVTDLIAATLPDATIGVSAWFSSRDAANRLGVQELVRPDCGFLFDTLAGAIDCYLEWDRGTETRETLKRKLDGYRLAEGRLHFDTRQKQSCNVLFVVPGPGRITTLRRAYDELEPKRERHRQSPYLVDLDGRWPLLAATASDLRQQGPLRSVWQRIDAEDEQRFALRELPVRDDLAPAILERTLGRRWRKEQPRFWQQLSPLHRSRDNEQPAPESAAPDSPAPAAAADLQADAFVERVRRLREAQLEEARCDLEDARSAGCWPGDVADLRPSGTDGLMPDPEATEEPWR